LRGRIYRVDLGEGVGPKPLLVVSNNRRNAALGDALAVRVTTTSKWSHLSSVAPIDPGGGQTGWVMCDDILTIDPDEVMADLGAVSAGTMERVLAALLHVFGGR
jgi:mRNA interferase MazF